MISTAEWGHGTSDSARSFLDLRTWAMAAEIKLTMRVPVVGTAPTGGAMRILSLSRQQAYRMQHAADPAEWFPLDASLGALQLPFMCLIFC